MTFRIIGPGPTWAIRPDNMFEDRPIDDILCDTERAARFMLGGMGDGWHLERWDADAQEWARVPR